MVFCEEEQIIMKCQPMFFFQNSKPGVTPQRFKTCLPYEGPTWNFRSYDCPGGIEVFLQNNTDMLRFILKQPHYHEILKCTSTENQSVTL